MKTYFAGEKSVNVRHGPCLVTTEQDPLYVIPDISSHFAIGQV